MTVSDEASGRVSREGHRRLGVLGTLVWDRIFHRGLSSEPLEEWGGISYTIEAMSVSLPKGWSICPIVKVGEDLAREALDYLSSIPGVVMEPGVMVVSQENPRVELRYRDADRRTERFSGGVPPWTWQELAPLLSGMEALYLNFITGFEMPLETGRRLREEWGRPLYADLHSLFQGISTEGDRFPRDLPDWEDWMQAFHGVQMNEEEFRRVGGTSGDPWQVAAEAVGSGLEIIAVTMGSRGSAFVASPDFSSHPAAWARKREAVPPGGTVRTGRRSMSGPGVSGDPTGCGDVWGATFFSRLLGGDSLEAAMDEANRMAARNVGYRGARGLRKHLQGHDGP